MNQVLCSTGALIGRPNNRDYRLLEQLSTQLTCDGYEFMMYSTWYDEADEVAQRLCAMQLLFPVMHCEKRIGRLISQGTLLDVKEAIRLFQINCKIAKKIESKKMVLHLWDGEISDSHFDNNLKSYGELLDIARDSGIDLLVENVVCNQQDPMKHWCELAEKYPQIHFVFDTKMAAFHNQIELLYDDKYDWLWKENHIHHFHVNDYAGGYMEWSKLRTLPMGKGNVDFDKFFDYIKKIQYQGTFTVEATAFDKMGEVDTKMLNESFDKIRNRMGEK